MNLFGFRRSSPFRPCLLVIGTCLAAVAASSPVAAQGTSADVAGVKNCSPTFSSATPALVTCGTPGLGVTAGTASANPNLLGAAASSIGTGNVIANSQFTDTVTYTASGSGTGFVGFEEILNGTITGIGNGADGSGLFTVSYNDFTSCTVTLSLEGTNGTDCIAYFPITFGVTNNITISGSLTVQAKNGGAGGVVADFSHTARIGNVGLYDANKNFISAVTLVGASGANYGTATPAIQVAVDIRPQGCPNPFNPIARGVLPVAILGSANFDVTTVDPSSVKLQGVPALRSSIEDVATPFSGSLVDANSCTSAGPDGFADMVLHFSNPAVAGALGSVAKDQVRTLTLTGNLLPAFGGTPIIGQDVILIVR